MRTTKQSIVDLFELDKMSPEKSAEVTDRLGKLIFQAVLVRVLTFLSKKDLTEYERIVSSREGGEAIFNFLSVKVPNFEKIILEESEKLRAELADEFATAEV